jgi:hypothetical protein
MRSVGLLWVSCACLTAQQAAIEGIAVHSVTGQPLSGVHVRLVARSHDGVSNVYGAMSDSGGHFSITGMQPGAYTLMPEKTGFVHMATRAGAVLSNAVTLKAGQRLTDFKLEMTPRAVISGRVLDENGDPVANVGVDAEPVSKDPPVATSMIGRRAGTNDRGEFRISGAPGKYRIRAMPRNMRAEDETRTDGTAAPAYGLTYYPSTAGRDQAGVVEAAAGGDTAGIEIRLVRLARGLTISGVVTGIPEAGRGATVLLQSGETAEEMTSIQGWGTSPDGKFVSSHLQPQFYRIFAQYRSGKIVLQSQKLELKLDSGDVTNLELVLRPGEELAGKLEIAGDPPATAEKRTIRLEPAEINFGDSRSAEVDKYGTFRFSSLPPEKYRVHVDPLPENAYLKAIQLDGAAAADGILDLSHGHASSLKITVGRNGGRISGAVLDKDGERLANSIATAYLLQTPAVTGQEHQAHVTPEGKYSFKGIRPGKYRLFVVDPLRSGIAREADAFKKLFAAAEEIEIKEGDRIAKDVKLAVKE